MRRALRLWSRRRRRPYTRHGIQRLKCIRCGNQATRQWQICAEGNNYRPVCSECDWLLNDLVLGFMRHPDRVLLLLAYRGKLLQEDN